MSYQVEVVWNREFSWSPYGDYPIIDSAVHAAKIAENMGDGARVKKARVLNSNGDVVWQGGKFVCPRNT